MHEFSLIHGLLKKIEAMVREQHAKRVIHMKVKLGALSHISPDHFREHFAHASQGTLAEGAQLEIETSKDTSAPEAQDIILESIELEEG